MQTFNQWRFLEAGKVPMPITKPVVLPLGLPARSIMTLDQFLSRELHEAKISLPMADDQPTPPPPVGNPDMLGATTKVVPPAEMQGYLSRVHTGTTDKVEKYKMPYVHKSNIKIQGANGQDFDLASLKAMIVKRPNKILKQNEKIKHSGGGATQFFNIGLPALKGLAVNEKSGDFVVVDTCPGAGVCKTYCYAKKSGYIQWAPSSLSQSKMLNFLLNDPEGFKSKLVAEIQGHSIRFDKKNTRIAVRWHDAGDFFSPDYWTLAKSVATALPNVIFYAYTKMASVATGDKPRNFVMNFSSGATNTEEKQIDFKTTKHSTVVPNELFLDLVVRDEATNKVKRNKDKKMEFTPFKMRVLKNRLAEKYQVDAKLILTYEQLMKKKEGGTPTWYVIVKPGDGDDSAYRQDVIGTYLLFH